MHRWVFRVLSHGVSRPLFLLSLAFVVGRASPPIYALVLFVVVLLGWQAERRRQARLLVALLIAWGAGAWWPHGHAPPVASFPTEISASVRSVELVSAGEKQRVTLRLGGVRAGAPQRWLSYPATVRATLAPTPELNPGDRIIVAGQLLRAEHRLNASDRFAPRARFLSRGAHGVRKRGSAVVRWWHQARRRLYRDLAPMPEPARSVARALTLGARAEMRPEIRRRWAAAGMAHLLAISGLHVTLVGGFAYGLLAAL
ncbi:MAG: ComEC/Rec2 family competence protein, partial [Myxococcota bacterium]